MTVRDTTKGFTLIELLVVIAVITLVSSIIILTLSVGRARAKDAQVIAEIKQLQNALELFYLDYGRYPLSIFCDGLMPPDGALYWCNSIDSLTAENHWIRDSGTTNILAPYIVEDPYRDSQGGASVWPVTVNGGIFYYSYGYGGTGKWYMLVFALAYPNKYLEASDGVTAPNGTYFHFGNGANGILTVGRSTKN